MNERIAQKIVQIYQSNPNQGMVNLLIQLDQIKGFQPREVAETFKEMVMVNHG